jgi:hypothetical protein
MNFAAMPSDCFVVRRINMHMIALLLGDVARRVGGTEQFFQ